MKRAQLLKIKAQVSCIWAKGCLFDDCVCVIGLYKTTPLWWRQKVMVYTVCVFPIFFSYSY